MSAMPARKRLWKAPPLIKLEVTLSITGRTATRFGSAWTSSSATRTAASSATAWSERAALARSANWSALNTARAT